jgi:glucosamine-6-phosphate deaminase
MPSKAITMGLGHIARANEILLLATGARKANIMASLLKSNTLSTNTPASTLLLHQNVTVIMDEDAASLYLKKASE